jgi:hypothetical protein
MKAQLKTPLLLDYENQEICSGCKKGEHRACSARKIAKMDLTEDYVNKKIFFFLCCCKKDSWSEEIMTHSAS